MRTCPASMHAHRVMMRTCPASMHAHRHHPPRGRQSEHSAGRGGRAGERFLVHCIQPSYVGWVEPRFLHHIQCAMASRKAKSQGYKAGSHGMVRTPNKHGESHQDVVYCHKDEHGWVARAIWVHKQEFTEGNSVQWLGVYDANNTLPQQASQEQVMPSDTQVSP